MQSSYKRSWPDSLGNIDTIVPNEFIISFLPLKLTIMTFSADENEGNPTLQETSDFSLYIVLKDKARFQKKTLKHMITDLRIYFRLFIGWLLKNKWLAKVLSERL